MSGADGDAVVPGAARACQNDRMGTRRAAMQQNVTNEIRAYTSR